MALAQHGAEFFPKPKPSGIVAVSHQSLMEKNIPQDDDGASAIIYYYLNKLKYVSI